MHQEGAVGTVIQDAPRSHDAHAPRWHRPQRAHLVAPSLARQAHGLSRRPAAKVRAVPRSPLQAGRASHERLDAPPAVVAVVHRAPGRACVPRLVVALPLGGPAVGACGRRLGCRLLTRSGRDRGVAAAYGTQQQVKRPVAEALVTSRHAASAR